MMMMMGGSDRERLHKKSTTMVASWASVYIEISKRLISSAQVFFWPAAAGAGPPPPY